MFRLGALEPYSLWDSQRRPFGCRFEVKRNRAASALVRPGRACCFEAEAAARGGCGSPLPSSDETRAPVATAPSRREQASGHCHPHVRPRRRSGSEGAVPLRGTEHCGNAGYHLDRPSLGRCGTRGALNTCPAVTVRSRAQRDVPDAVSRRALGLVTVLLSDGCLLPPPCPLDSMGARWGSAVPLG
jgi:hypothetical protein